MATKKPSKEEARRMTEEVMKNGLVSDPMLPLKKKNSIKKKAPATGRK